MKLSSIFIYGLRVGSDRKLVAGFFRSFSFVLSVALAYARSQRVDVCVIRFFALPHNPRYVERCVLFIPKDFDTSVFSCDSEDLPF